MLQDTKRNCQVSTQIERRYDYVVHVKTQRHTFEKWKCLRILIQEVTILKVPTPLPGVSGRKVALVEEYEKCD